MNKQLNHYVIFGGAGYLGQFLIQYLKSTKEKLKITIVTRNKTKAFLFRDKNIKVSDNSHEIKNQKISIINLAFSLYDTFPETKTNNEKIISEISSLIQNNSVECLVHISTIILSLNKKNWDSVDVKKYSMYYYAKSYFEKRLKQISTKFKTPVYVIRSGNIIGPGSPWINNIFNSLIHEKPITGNEKYYPSNSTFVGNISKIIFLFCQKKPKLNNFFMVYNFAEFGNICWKEIIEKLNNNRFELIKWDIPNSNHLNASFSKELIYVFKKTLKFFIPAAYKLPMLNNIIVKLFSVLNFKSPKEKFKLKVNNEPKISSSIYELMEYDKISVFLNKEKMTTENIPKEFLDILDYNLDESLKTIKYWSKFSGFKSFFENKR